MAKEVKKFRRCGKGIGNGPLSLFRDNVVGRMEVGRAHLTVELTVIFEALHQAVHYLESKDRKQENEAQNW